MSLIMLALSVSIAIILVIVINSVIANAVQTIPFPDNEYDYITSDAESPETALASSVGPPGMNITTGDDYVYLGTGAYILVGEKAVAVNSLICDVPVKGVSLTLTRTGSPQGDIEFSVFNYTGNTLHTFGTINATSLTDNDDSYAVNGTEYITEVGQRIGIKYIPTNTSGNFAIDFDAVDTQYITFGDVADYDDLAEFTITSWVVKEDSSISSNHNIFSKRASSGNGFHGGFAGSTNKVNFFVSDGTTAASVTGLGAAITDQEWHHIAWVFKGSEYVVTYLDGQLNYNYTNAKPTKALANTLPFVIGAGGSFLTPANATIDDFRFYNVAKTAEEIQTIKSGESDTNGLIGWWKFDETGTTAVDSSSANHDGTLTNNPERIGSNIGDNVKVKINTLDPFDNTDSILSVSDDEIAWTDLSNSDIVQKVFINPQPAVQSVDSNSNTYWSNGIVQENESSITVDMGENTRVGSISYTFNKLIYIPNTANIYVSNDPDNMGAIAKSIVFAQDDLTQTFVIADDDSQTGRYIKTEITDFNSTKTIRLDEITITPLDAIIVGGPSQAERDLYNGANNIGIVAFSILLTMLIIGVVLYIRSMVS